MSNITENEKELLVIFRMLKSEKMQNRFLGYVQEYALRLKERECDERRKHLNLIK